MKQIDINPLFTKLWHEIESIGHGAGMTKEGRKIRNTIDTCIFGVEECLAETFIELGDYTQSKGHALDRVLEQILALSYRAATQMDNIHPAQVFLRKILEYFISHLNQLIFDLRSKYAHLQLARLVPASTYISFIIKMEDDKVNHILIRLEGSGIHPSIVASLKAYFKNPVPTIQHNLVNHDYNGFQSLDYFVGLVEALYAVCNKTSRGDFEENLYAELINRNFNHTDFIRTLIQVYKKEVEEIHDPMQEIIHLYEVERKIRKIPVVVDMAYIPARLGLKEHLLKAVNAEIIFLRKVIKYRKEVIGIAVPKFKLNRNVIQVLILYNVLLNLSYITPIGRGSIPNFIHENFIRSNDRKFSLNSLQKKNSLRDDIHTEGLIEMLNDVIAYVKRVYLE